MIKLLWWQFPVSILSETLENVLWTFSMCGNIKKRICGFAVEFFEEISMKFDFID